MPRATDIGRVSFAPFIAFAVVFLVQTASAQAPLRWTVTTEVLSGGALTSGCAPVCQAEPIVNLCVQPAASDARVRMRFTVRNEGPAITNPFVIALNWGAPIGGAQLEVRFVSLPAGAACFGPTVGPTPSDRGNCEFASFGAGATAVVVADVSSPVGFTGQQSMTVYPQVPAIPSSFFPLGQACVRFTDAAPPAQPIPTLSPVALVLLAAAVVVIACVKAL